MGARRLLMPPGMTRSVVEYAARRGRGGGAGCPATAPSGCRALLKEDERLLRLYFDGVFAALQTLHALKKESALHLRGAPGDCPPVFRSDRVFAVELKDRGALLRKLAESVPGASLTDGVSFEDERGWAWDQRAGRKKRMPRPCRSRERGNSAKELCDFCTDNLEKLMKESQT